MTFAAPDKRIATRSQLAPVGGLDPLFADAARRTGYRELSLGPRCTLNDAAIAELIPLPQLARRCTTVARRRPSPNLTAD